MEKVSLNNLKCIDTNIDIDEYIKFRDEVQSKMEYPDWLGDFTKEDIEYVMNNGSKIWIYYDRDKPVCSMMFIPSDEHSIKKMGMDNLDYKVVGDYGPMFVSDEYRGNGLQYQMLCALDKYLIDNGYQYAVVTVHPENVYSIKNLVKDNFELVSRKMFTRGIRYVYKKELIGKMVK